MSPATIFQIQLVLGYVPWLLCFGVYVMPRLKSIDRVEAQRAIATLHSFRFFRARLYHAGRRRPQPAVARRRKRLRARLNTFSQATTRSSKSWGEVSSAAFERKTRERTHATTTFAMAAVSPL